jgi:hypothetical protein
MIAHVGWVVFNVLGFCAGFFAGLWVEWWVSLAIIEAVGLAVGDPFTFTVRWALRRRKGPWGFAWDVAVTLWCVTMVATWWLYAPIPLWASGPIGLAFGVWSMDHFFREDKL